MRRLAVVHPTSLLGRELRERLDRRRELWSEIRLLSNREEEIGTVTEVADRAMLVERPDAVDGLTADLILLCDDMEHSAPLLSRLTPTAMALVLARDVGSGVGQVLVNGVNLDGSELEQVLVSPPAGVLALSRLLEPLRSLGLIACTATLLQPASARGEEAIEEVFSQTRSLLGFRPIGSGGPFGAQIAFNLLPMADDGARSAAGLLREVLGDDVHVSVQVLQAGVFHGLSISACCRFEEDPSDEAVRTALDSAPGVELVEGAAGLGPVLAASRSEVLVGHARAAEEWPGAHWLWAVGDHLVLEADNALAIAAVPFGES